MPSARNLLMSSSSGEGPSAPEVLGDFLVAYNDQDMRSIDDLDSPYYADIENPEGFPNFNDSTQTVITDVVEIGEGVYGLLWSHRYNAGSGNNWHAFYNVARVDFANNVEFSQPELVGGDLSTSSYVMPATKFTDGHIAFATSSGRRLIVVQVDPLDGSFISSSYRDITASQARMALLPLGDGRHLVWYGISVTNNNLEVVIVDALSPGLPISQQRTQAVVEDGFTSNWAIEGLDAFVVSETLHMLCWMGPDSGDHEYMGMMSVDVGPSSVGDYQMKVIWGGDQIPERLPKYQEWSDRVFANPSGDKESYSYLDSWVRGSTRAEVAEGLLLFVQGFADEIWDNNSGFATASTIVFLVDVNGEEPNLVNWASPLNGVRWWWGSGDDPVDWVVERDSYPVKLLRMGGENRFVGVHYAEAYWGNWSWNFPFYNRDALFRTWQIEVDPENGNIEIVSPHIGDYPVQAIMGPHPRNLPWFEDHWNSFDGGTIIGSYITYGGLYLQPEPHKLFVFSERPSGGSVYVARMAHIGDSREGPPSASDYADVVASLGATQYWLLDDEAGDFQPTIGDIVIQGNEQVERRTADHFGDGYVRFGAGTPALIVPSATGLANEEWSWFAWFLHFMRDEEFQEWGTYWNRMVIFAHTTDGDYINVNSTTDRYVIFEDPERDGYIRSNGFRGNNIRPSPFRYRWTFLGMTGDEWTTSYWFDGRKVTTFYKAHPFEVNMGGALFPEGFMIGNTPSMEEGLIGSMSKLAIFDRQLAENEVDSLWRNYRPSASMPHLQPWEPDQ